MLADEIIDKSGRLSPTALSNLYTMGCTAEVDPRQVIPEPYTIPPEEIRLLRARLIFEEALETIHALGFNVYAMDDEVFFGIIMQQTKFKPHSDGPNLEDIIDGCCDEIYVSVGTLMACGVCDAPHMRAVNRANNAKFPNGRAVVNEHGKFQKPDGWTAPCHMTVKEIELQRAENEQLDPPNVTSAYLVSALKQLGDLKNK